MDPSPENKPITAERPTTGITPYLTIGGGRAREATEFYERAFAGQIVERTSAEDGQRLLQASLKINSGWIMLTDAFPERGHLAGIPEGTTLHLQVDDADTWFTRAVDAGCTVKRPLADQFWGDRYGQLIDPFGHQWGIASTL